MSKVLSYYLVHNGELISGLTHRLKVYLVMAYTWSQAADLPFRKSGKQKPPVSEDHQDDQKWKALDICEVPGRKTPKSKHPCWFRQLDIDVVNGRVSFHRCPRGGLAWGGRKKLSIPIELSTSLRPDEVMSERFRNAVVQTDWLWGKQEREADSVPVAPMPQPEPALNVLRKERHRVGGRELRVSENQPTLVGADFGLSK